MSKLIIKESNTSLEKSQNDYLAKGLYLDNMYVQDKVVELVIEAAKSSGFLPHYAHSGNLSYVWIIDMTHHHLMILSHQESAKENPYSPSDMRCLNRKIKQLSCKVNMALADILTNHYPPIQIPK